MHDIPREFGDVIVQVGVRQRTNGLCSKATSRGSLRQTGIVGLGGYGPVVPRLAGEVKQLRHGDYGGHVDVQDFTRA